MTGLVWLGISVFLLVCFTEGHSPLSSAQKTAILLDVDNTLYSESQTGIEAQIVRNTHAYCQERLGISTEKADDLFHAYGSTIEGLRRTIWLDNDEASLQAALKDFYRSVYRDIDMSNLILSGVPDGSISSTGYSHTTKDRQLACRLLKACPLPISVASNSPSWHVQKILKYLGLDELGLQDVLTPDRLPNYPTKHESIAFFEGSTAVDTSDRLLFFDDSHHNLKSVAQALLNVEPIHISSTNLLGNALLRHLGLVDPTYQFDPVRYLESKNQVDSQSLHPDIWNQVMAHLRDGAFQDSPIRIVDLGAGRLNILKLMIQGDTSQGLNALFGHPKKDVPISYTAYESNRELLSSCKEQLESLGFQLKDQRSSDELVYSNGNNFEVRLFLRDYEDCEDGSKGPAPDLIVGCCFADLKDPNILVPSILRCFGLLGKTVSSKTLFYFPITFAGVTQFLPPRPFETSEFQTIPSDTVAFDIYSNALTKEMGHNVDPFALQKAFEEHGATLLDKGASNWKIDPDKHHYLFDTMMYFFGTTAGPPLMDAGLDAAGWIGRARNSRPSIQVSNVDLLFRLKGENLMTDAPEACGAPDTTKLEEIQFTAPETVTTIFKPMPILGANQVLIESSYSLISSGTELKVFKGLFDDAALDVNIKSMEDERMTYPLAYGYCLVGRIVKCGSGVSGEKYLGKLAFTFSAHATHVAADVDGIQLVPEGVSAEDAIFMPSVETALSLVHDAHVRVGENVAVYGQGLIGLLVTAILSRSTSADHSSSGNYGVTTAFDTIPDRLAASALMGATQVLMPGGFPGPFDVAIEVSGNPRALQSAIDSVADGGRVIVGSWYGNTDVSLKLGMDFHRSHKTLQTSQVSDIPASLRGLWNKQRRFGLAWELVQQLKPSRLLTKTTSLRYASTAYKALDQGTELAVAFKYDSRKKM